MESRSIVMYNDERTVAECPAVILIMFEMCGSIGRSYRVVERTHSTHDARCLREFTFRLSLVYVMVFPEEVPLADAMANVVSSAKGC